MTKLEHRLGPGGILSGCEPYCPACAANATEREKRRRVSIRVRELVLGVWLEAVASGERDIERALRDIRPALLRLPDAERREVAGEFVLAALDLTPHQSSKVRGMPSAWRKATRELVELVADSEALSKNDVRQYHDSVYTRVASLWTSWGIGVTPRQVMDA